MEDLTRICDNDGVVISDCTGELAGYTFREKTVFMLMVADLFDGLSHVYTVAPSYDGYGCRCGNESEYVYCCNGRELFNVCNRCHNSISIMISAINNGLRWWVMNNYLFIIQNDQISFHSFEFPFTVVPLHEFMVDDTTFSPKYDCSVCDRPLYQMRCRTYLNDHTVCGACYGHMATCVRLTLQKITTLREIIKSPDDIRQVIIGIIIDTFDERMIKGKIYRENNNINLPAGIK